jgi:hypothetical protein
VPICISGADEPLTLEELQRLYARRRRRTRRRQQPSEASLTAMQEMGFSAAEAGFAPPPFYASLGFSKTRLSIILLVDLRKKMERK